MTRGRLDLSNQASVCVQCTVAAIKTRNCGHEFIELVEECVNIGRGSTDHGDAVRASRNNLPAREALLEPVETIRVHRNVTVEERILELVRRRLDLERSLNRTLVIHVAASLHDELVNVSIATKDDKAFRLLVDRARGLGVTSVHGTERDTGKSCFLVVRVRVALDGHERDAVKHGARLDERLKDALLEVRLRKLRSLGESDSHELTLLFCGLRVGSTESPHASAHLSFFTDRGHAALVGNDVLRHIRDRIRNNLGSRN